MEKSLVDAEVALTEVATRKASIEEEMQLRSRRSEELRLANDDLRRDLAGLQSQLAVLQERRSTVARELAMLAQQAADLGRPLEQRGNADTAGGGTTGADARYDRSRWRRREAVWPNSSTRLMLQLR